jgi:biopolymer transport protein ExbD/biopolymer transport protein TolR
MKIESVRAMLRKSRPSPKLFSDFNTLQFASVMGMVVFVVLLIFMTIPVVDHHGGSVDLPKVLHPVAMRGADREDAIKISITRDGKVYLGTEQVWLPALPAKIQDRLKDREVERKVYIVADMRARWGGVKLALDGVRSAGIIRVAILADQERLPQLSR